MARFAFSVGVNMSLWRRKPSEFPADPKFALFLEHVKASRLLSEEKLGHIIEEFKANSRDPGSFDDFAVVLVNRGWLTSWQCDKLRDEKYKGFYLDDYKLLGHYDTDEERSYYVAERLKNGEKVILGVWPKTCYAPGDNTVHYEVLPYPDGTRLPKPRFTVSDGETLLILTPDVDGGYVVTSPFDPALITEADTIETAFKNARDAEDALRDSRKKPPPK
jgi:hypothetical protein